MKKTLITLNVLCFLVVTSVFTSYAQKTSGPVFAADKMELDFGEVPYGGNDTREFKFKNTGTEPLLISDAKGSCGCTVPEWPKEPIRPGQTEVIKVKYDTKRSGPITKTVTITTNEIDSKDAAGNPIYKRHTIQIKGNVKQAPSTDGVPQKNTGGAPVE